METPIKMNMISQLFSGRWLLTMAAANGLLLLTATLCWQAVHDVKPFMDPGALLAVYTMVFMAYFQKPTENRPIPGSQVMLSGSDPAAPIDPSMDALSKK